MDTDALILGGGFAGLSCAVALAEKGRRVTVLEKKPHLGGRAYSFKDPESGHSVDNGQHLFLGCYRQTRQFLKTIGTEGQLKFLPEIRLDFADAQGHRSALHCPSYLGAPWHLAAGVLGFSGLSLADKWGMTRLNHYIKKTCANGLPAELDHLTVSQWLASLRQSPRICERLFDPIALGALNDDPGVASALGLAQALREAFFRDADSARLGLASVGLSDLYTQAATSYIESRGGKVILSRKSVALSQENGRVTGVRTEFGEDFKAACVVSTLAPWDLQRLDLPPALRGSWTQLKAAPIIGLSLWLDRPILENEPLVGLIGTEFQWVFNKSRILGDDIKSGQYLSLVISGAHRQISWDPKELLAAAQQDLSRCFSAFQKAKILRWKVVKEPFSTLSPVPGSDALRPRPGEAMPGFYFAGDWTKTGLPATIESAVASGRQVAQMIIAKEEHHDNVG